MILQITLEAMSDLSEKCSVLHKKLQSRFASQISRSQALKSQLDKASEEREESENELRIFETLHAREQGVGIPSRLEALEQEVIKVREREREGQERYRQLTGLTS